MNVSILFRKFCVTPVVLLCFPLKFWAGNWRGWQKNIHLGMRRRLTAVFPRMRKRVTSRYFETVVTADSTDG